MEFRELEYFMKVYEKNSFTEAARSLYMTQPALSRTIKKLESELDISLFETSGKKIIPTEAGEVLYREGRKIMQMYHHTLGEINSLQAKETGTIRIATSFQRGVLFWLYDQIEAYSREHNGIRIQLEEKSPETVFRNVSNGDIHIDLTNIYGHDIIHDLHYHVLMKQHLSLLALTSHPLMQKKSLTISDFINVPIFTTNTDLNRFFIKCCEKQGFSPNINLVSTHMDTILSLIRQNRGVAITDFTPESMMHYMDKYDFPKFDKERTTFGKRELETDEFLYSMVLFTRKETEKLPLIQDFIHFLLQRDL